ncbi:MAG: DoxX family protein [Acidobacteria bacterium]|nr:DoxX family protein [Acidobacteriota bacterium]MCB9398564.1 DoxX family protein [Acidobacteriota bacterium]
MKNVWFQSTCTDALGGLTIVRVAIALIIAVHPLHGLLHPADINGFGGFLSSQGLPFGVALAWLTIGTQVLCSLALVWGRFVVPACFGHVFILALGLWFVHVPNGWFVVGASTGGMEFSVTLIAALFGVLWSYWPRKS